ncbi:uncharacterized protein MONOS_9279 [Monocercomonoides exilis]|uniref:uncharacterized protein n=1 Tax=Monocercomonoides exilis TaxID=2049356 RepID=UPI00355A0B1B|nr:hypothetical protein MONOS_9279 [Monocercomonoides exilis]|eukprot:MONOS_9279.1-p1 / transcript=MONOS_9279.1 / gene=MONOS_9279 / organism=Monocercomonoides_exilis_PA203 / gene_product=unspecified product / transcript_product=unspecified product / location=Mono_scaffold00376:54153-54710(+) / protein_length=140 / sequence_SO=supercontig / SO=protein_coding / is_pseudo=false
MVKKEFVKMSIGVVMIVDCEFVTEMSKEGIGSFVSDVWVWSMKGGEMQMDRVTKRGIEFCGGGILSVEGGRSELEIITAKDVKKDGEGCGFKEGNGREMKCEVAEGVVVVESSTFEGFSARKNEEKGGEIFINAVGESC